MQRLRVLSVIVAVVGLGCASPWEVAPAPPPVADRFPREPLEQVCGRVPSRLERLPERHLASVYVAMERLDEELLRRRVCTAATRQEASVGLAMLARSRGDEALLADIAETWGEPLALAALSADGDDPGDRADALAAAAILQALSARTGRPPPPQVLAAMPQRVSIPPDPATAAADRRRAERAAERYAAWFAEPTKVAAR